MLLACAILAAVAMLVTNDGPSPYVALVNLTRPGHNAPSPGAMAQLGARLHGMQKVEGSSPSGSSVVSTAER